MGGIGGVGSISSGIGSGIGGGIGGGNGDGIYGLMFDDPEVDLTAGAGYSGAYSGEGGLAGQGVFAAGSGEAQAQSQSAVARRVAEQVAADREEAKRLYFQGGLMVAVGVLSDCCTGWQFQADHPFFLIG
jgi:hypothetical protein